MNGSKLLLSYDYNNISSTISPTISTSPNLYPIVFTNFCRHNIECTTVPGIPNLYPHSITILQLYLLPQYQLPLLSLHPLKLLPLSSDTIPQSLCLQYNHYHSAPTISPITICTTNLNPPPIPHNISPSSSPGP